MRVLAVVGLTVILSLSGAFLGGVCATIVDNKLAEATRRDHNEPAWDFAGAFVGFVLGGVAATYASLRLYREKNAE